MFGFGRHQAQAPVPKGPEGPGDWVVDVTDPDGHTTEYVGMTTKQKNNTLRNCRNDRRGYSASARER